MVLLLLNTALSLLVRIPEGIIPFNPGRRWCGGETSRIWLLVAEDARLEQMVKQVRKLEDVLSVRRHTADHEAFERLEKFFR